MQKLYSVTQGVNVQPLYVGWDRWESLQGLGLNPPDLVLEIFAPAGDDTTDGPCVVSSYFKPGQLVVVEYAASRQ